MFLAHIKNIQIFKEEIIENAIGKEIFICVKMEQRKNIDLISYCKNNGQLLLNIYIYQASL